MSGVEALMLVLRWTHILSAIALMGGAMFMRFALLPAAATLSDDAHVKLRGELRSRWAPIVMAAAGLLLLSGLANFVLTVIQLSFDKSTLAGKLYHPLFGVKFLLALPVFHIAALLVGKSEAAQRARQNARFWLTLNLVLATAIVLIGGFLRTAPRGPKVPTRETSLESSRPAAVESSVARSSATRHPSLLEGLRRG